MKKTVSSPHWTGSTVFTVGAKGQEQRKTKQHLMHDKMFSAEVIIKQVPKQTSKGKINGNKTNKEEQP